MPSSETVASDGQGGATLCSLPDDILRRIIDTVGGPTLATGPPFVPDAASNTSLKTAHILAAVSSKLRSYVINSYLPSVTSIRHIDLLPLTKTENTAYAAEAVISLLSRTSGLKHFSSDGTRPNLVTSAAIAALATTATSTIEDVDIRFIDVTDEAVKPLFGCPHLRKLQMSFGRETTPNLFHFGPGGSITAPLVHLDLTWVKAVDTNALYVISQVGTLQTLMLKSCEAVDDEGARILANGQAAKSLRTLNIVYCPLGNEALISLIRALPNIETLFVAERAPSSAIPGAYSQAGIDEAKEVFPNVRITTES